MIIIGGGGGALVLLLFLGVMVLFFVVLPLTLLRGARRSVQVLGPGGWSPAQYPPEELEHDPAGWQPPHEPVLPEVHAADVSSLRDRLGHDVRTLDPGPDPADRQAMADASERYSTASTLLERASSQAQLRTAWLAAVEGLSATRSVRQRHGLDLGPPVPALPGTGPQLTRHARIDIEGRSHVGAPSYEPGRPHWFPGGYYGGRHVPGGWYDVPFWPSALLLGGLGGWALGAGLGAGLMYGEDLGAGWGDGGDLGGDLGGDFGGYGGGGGWDGGGDGSGGGGDWGGDPGGGDFGGGGGGGDWGGGGDLGGGGDFGGGGDW